MSFPSGMIWRAVLICFLAWAGAATAEEPTAKSYYLIGNSLTWDTMPSRLDGDVQWHVDCGKSLPYIHANPAMPCVKSSKLWPTALKQKQFDYLSLQPHYGSTMKEDLEFIRTLMAMQPRAVVVIHTGWAFHEKLDAEYRGTEVTQMQHNPAYFRQLLSALRKEHPTRTIRSTRAMHLLFQVATDVEAEQAPYGTLADIYRDKIHMTTGGGRYLMHNAMRIALDQPITHKGFEQLDQRERAYLDGLLKDLKNWR